MTAFVNSSAFRALIFLCGLAVSAVHAETVYYELDNVFLDDGSHLTGIFSWIYIPGDYENGLGEFVSLDIPWTAHNQTNLNIMIDVGSSIEFTLAGNYHDDGVDISLFLLDSLTPTNGVSLDLLRSEYDIGGNGFHTGGFLGGRVIPVQPILSMGTNTIGQMALSWSPEVPGNVLQEQKSLSTNWVNSASGITNPVVISTTNSAAFYRVVFP